ncbi:family 43 glycosylhydrolase [Niabella aquatica]
MTFRIFNYKIISVKSIFLLLGIFPVQLKLTGQIINFDKGGRQLVKFDLLGNAVDAHDGEIAKFNGVYYLYGTSYNCGYEWGNKDAPFCGFKVYTSTNLKDWKDNGFLFDAQTAIWQRRCNGKTYGCYRPHVIYNKKTKLYVLWINVYDNIVGYRVFTSPTPAGPFSEVAEPKLAVNANMPVAGLNNGDHDTFIDDDGTAYLAYTDWRANGVIMIEQLSDDYLTGTGKHVKSVTAEKTEAPCLFKRNNLYYVVYSDPNCGYCSGTGSSYKTSESPLGPWSDPVSISNNSCGGQPSFVSKLKVDGEIIYLYGSDLWNNAAKNEALANYYWAPLEFTETGAIKPLACAETYLMKKKTQSAASSKNKTGADGFSIKDDIKDDSHYAQSFTIRRSGKLNHISITLFKNNHPDSDLMLELYNTDKNGLPTGNVVFSKYLKPEQLGWSPRKIVIHPEIQVVKGKVYSLVLRTNTTTGNYGFVMKETSTPGETLAWRGGKAQQFTLLPQKTIQLETNVISIK